MTLLSLLPGQQGLVHRVGISGPVGARLAEMGLVPGATVRVVRLAPLGDPVAIQVQGFELALRKRDAVRVEIDGEGFDA